MAAAIRYIQSIGLENIEAGKAGILATIEPLVATLIGVIVFSEPITILSGLGILLILAAVIVLNIKKTSVKTGDEY